MVCTRCAESIEIVAIVAKSTAEEIREATARDELHPLVAQNLASPRGLCNAATATADGGACMCVLDYGHEGPHRNPHVLLEWVETCMTCRSPGGEGLTRYRITVDGVPLNLAPLLCAEHGSRFLLRTGAILATLEKPIEDVIEGWALPVQVAESGRAYEIPEHTRNGLDRWVREGLAGDFLRAVLRNDLVEAAGRADALNAPRLPAIVQYVYNECPSDCYGSPAKVEAWAARFKES